MVEFADDPGVLGHLLIQEIPVIAIPWIRSALAKGGRGIEARCQ